jgi:hypothetical protein
MPQVVEVNQRERCPATAPVSIVYAEKGQTFVDNKVYDTCNGGAGEGNASKGEGSCSLTTAVCVNPPTEGKTEPVACPSDQFSGGRAGSARSWGLSLGRYQLGMPASWPVSIVRRAWW